MPRQRQSIRKQVFIPLTLTFLVLLAAFIYSTHIILQEKITREMAHRYSKAQSTFDILMTRRLETMDSVAEFIARDQSFQAAMRRGDRKALDLFARPYFDRMVAKGGFTHFSFHTPDGGKFLRVHRPGAHEEEAIRQTMRHAVKTGLPAHGLELGSLGTLALRQVVPWRDSTGQLGFIELGTEVESLLNILKQIVGVDYVLTIDKRFLQRKEWEEGMLALGRTPSWDQLSTKVVYSETLESIPPDLLRLLEQSTTFQSSTSTSTSSSDSSPLSSSTGEKWQGISVGSQSFAIRRLKFTQTGGVGIGDFYVLYDTTPEKKSFYDFVLRVIFFCLLLTSSLFVFAWRILGRVDRNLADTSQKLLNEIATKGIVNAELNKEIAGRQHVEQDLVQLNEQLEQRVADRTQNLEDMKVKIEQSRNELEAAYLDLKGKQATILQQDKMASIGQLAAGVAHDINNPIGFVYSNLEELRTYLARLKSFIELQQSTLGRVSSGPLLEEVQQQYRELDIERILSDLDIMIAESLEGTERVRNTVQNLRNFSRIDDVAYKLADIHDCLESTINITGNEFKYKAEVKRDYGEIPAILCYPQQLNQVFMNLIINAAQAIEKRGEITIRTWAFEKSVYVSLSDTGNGIAPEALSRIFEPYFTTKEVGEGTGLGLSITYDIIKKHRGDISVESEVGLGTTFTIRLPFDRRSRPRDRRLS